MRRFWKVEGFLGKSILVKFALLLRERFFPDPIQLAGRGAYKCVRFNGGIGGVADLLNNAMSRT